MISLSDDDLEQAFFLSQTIGNCNLLCYNDSKHAYKEGLVSNSCYILCYTMLVTSDYYKESYSSAYSTLSCYSYV